MSIKLWETLIYENGWPFRLWVLPPSSPFEFPSVLYPPLLRYTLVLRKVVLWISELYLFLEILWDPSSWEVLPLCAKDGDVSCSASSAHFCQTTQHLVTESSIFIVTALKYSKLHVETRVQRAAIYCVLSASSASAANYAILQIEKRGFYLYM
jgi:hypothetical protein